MYKVYILKSELFSKSYVGLTNDLERRIKEHNLGKHFYTKRYKPWKIVYHENFNSLVEARKREKYLKSASGRKYLKNDIFRNRE